MKRIFLPIVFAILLSSCSTVYTYNYVNDSATDTSIKVDDNGEIRVTIIGNKDKMTVYVLNDTENPLIIDWQGAVLKDYLVDTEDKVIVVDDWISENCFYQPPTVVYAAAAINIVNSSICTYDLAHWYTDKYHELKPVRSMTAVDKWLTLTLPIKVNGVWHNYEFVLNNKDSIKSSIELCI